MVTFCKRKKGVIKKAMELSKLCGFDVMMSIFDKEKNRLIMYQSKKDFGPYRVVELLSINETKTKYYEEYQNKDFDHIEAVKNTQTFDLRLDSNDSSYV